MRVQERISSVEETASDSSMTLESSASSRGTRPSVARAARSVSAEGAAGAPARICSVSSSAFRRRATARRSVRSLGVGAGPPAATACRAAFSSQLSSRRFSRPASSVRSGPVAVVVELDGAEHAVDVGLPELRILGVGFDLFDELERLVDVLGGQPRQLEASEDLPDRFLQLDDLARLQVGVPRLAFPPLAGLVELAELVGGRHVEAAARQLLLEIADALGRFLEPPLLAFVQPVEDGARAQVAGSPPTPAPPGGRGRCRPAA